MNPHHLETKHTLERDDPKHRYGALLLPYFDHYRTTSSQLPFFEWLESTESKGVDELPSFLERKNAKPREELESSRVQYLSSDQADRYRVQYKNVSGTNKLVWAGLSTPVEGAKTGDNVHTNNIALVGDLEEKWIFVISTAGVMYLGPKIKRKFHHSSFVAGGPVWCAGRAVVDHGVVRMLMPYSGHYLTSMEVLDDVSELFFGRRMPLGDPEHILDRRK